MILQKRFMDKTNGTVEDLINEVNASKLYLFTLFYIIYNNHVVFVHGPLLLNYHDKKS